MIVAKIIGKMPMPRGGFRVGGGRPKGSKDRQKRIVKARARPTPPLDAASPPNEEPLDYMRRVMRDPKADVARRDRMALALAGLQVRLGELSYVGKKERAQREAMAAATGTWAELLGEGETGGDDLNVAMAPRKPAGHA